MNIRIKMDANISIEVKEKIEYIERVRDELQKKVNLIR